MDKRFERITITYENGDGYKTTSSYEQPEIKLDDLFWAWFVPVWASLGLDGITKGIKEHD